MTVQPAEQQRAMRECDGCHVVDDLGHHQVVRPTDDGLVVESLHFACCAKAGCPDGSCTQIVNRSAPGV
jgi:hypothetical protein